MLKQTIEAKHHVVKHCGCITTHLLQWLISTGRCLQLHHLQVHMVMNKETHLQLVLNTALKLVQSLRLFTITKTITNTVILSTKCNEVSIIPSPTDPELSCSYCRESSQILLYLSHLTLSSRAQDHWTHWIQAPLTYLLSSHNYLTSIPS